MGFLSRFRATPDSETRTTLANPEAWLLEALGATPTASGLTLTPETAAALPDVFACCQVLAQDVARTPLRLQAMDASGNRSDASDTVLWELLFSLPNPETTAFDFRYQLMWDMLLHERAYAEIRRTPDGRVSSLWRLEPWRMHVDRDTSGAKRWRYRTLHDAAVTGVLQIGGGYRELSWTFNPDKPPILEVTMLSPIRRVRETLGLVAAVERYGAKFFANGAKLSGLFSLPANARDEDVRNFYDKLRALFGGADNAHKQLVTRGDLKYQPFVANNDEAQFNETRRALRPLIAGCFRVPPHKIGDLERATFSNIEHQEIEYVNSALGPFYNLIEQALRRDVLTTRQYPRFDVVFDRQALIPVDLSALSVALSTQINAGIISVNDARRRLGMNTIDGRLGDAHIVNGNMVPLARQLAEPPPAPEAPAPAMDMDADPMPKPDQVM